MPPPATKRRKLSPSDEEVDGASLLSSGDEPVAEADEAHHGNDHVDESSHIESDEDSGDNEDEVGGDGDSKLVRRDMPSSHGEQGTTSPKAKPKPKRPTEVRRNEASIGAAPFTGEVYKSNLFKLQVDDLLKQVRPKYQQKDKSIEQALRTLKGIIEAIPSRPPAPVAEAEASLRKLEHIIVPFPSPHPPKDANYKLQYAKPAHINATGSFPLRTNTSSQDSLTIDLVLTMPGQLFQDKDYLNHRYFYKRAFYLGCIAAGLKANKTQVYEVAFDHLHGNHLLPVLMVKFPQRKNLSVVILPTIDEGFFSHDKLMPSRNCVRPRESTETSGSKALEPTPFYNASLVADTLVTSYMELQHAASKGSDSYKDACVLGRIWLRQRGFSGRIQGGGFGNFEWAATMALLLRGGGSKGLPAFSSGYNSYQLFKAALQYLASKDLAKTPQIVGGQKVEFPASNGRPMLFDGERSHNLLFKMTPWSYKLLQNEARASVSMLSDSTFDRFEGTFILRSDRPLYRYDVVVNVPLAKIVKSWPDVDSALHSLYDKLCEGLLDRVKSINLSLSEDETWDTTKGNVLNSKRSVTIGFILDTAQAHRLIDHGPPAESKAEAAKFRKFWGDKAELRRFKDGSILESVIWSSKHDPSSSIFQQVVSTIIGIQFDLGIVNAMAFVGDEEKKILPDKHTTRASFQPVMDAFRKLEKDLRGLEDIPLHIRHVLASDPYLSYSSVDIPFIPNATRMARPADIVLQFEGSARWPDDLEAIQRTKMAFFLKIAESVESKLEITARVGLENDDAPLSNQSFLDIVYPSGAAFRIRIHHDREITLLDRQMKDKSLSNNERAEVARAVAMYKRVFIKEPAHTQGLQTLSTRHPAFSGTVRLLIHWFSSHLLSNHFTPCLISLFAVRVFTNPHPWSVPSSPQAGFLRALLFLSRWDWRSEPWIVDLGSDMRANDVEPINTRFEAWRKIDPALNRVVLFATSNIDGDGNTWTDGGRPAKVVAGRMTALAKAAVDLINSKGIELEFGQLFESDLGDYDMRILLNYKLVDRLRKPHLSKKMAAYKNLELQNGNGDNSDSFLVGFSPVQMFLVDLERIFGQALVFFSEDAGGAEVIAGLWNPQAEERGWKLTLGYSAIPVAAEDGKVTARLNKEGILSEIARLGGALVKTIEVKGR